MAQHVMPRCWRAALMPARASAAARARNRDDKQAIAMARDKTIERTRTPRAMEVNADTMLLCGAPRRAMFSCHATSRANAQPMLQNIVHFTSQTQRVVRSMSSAAEFIHSRCRSLMPSCRHQPTA